MSDQPRQTHWVLARPPILPMSSGKRRSDKRHSGFRLVTGKRSFWVGLLVVLCCMQHAAAKTRPNIVFLMSDDQCTYSLGCYGTPGVQTPNIDRLAQDGIVFDNHYVTTAICMASRATVVTGKYEYKHGCNFEHGPLLKEHWQDSYPVLLRSHGYVTGFAGKIGFVVANAVGDDGNLPEDDFDSWGAGPGQTHYQTRKNPSMMKYADEYPHSTRAYGAFGRDFIRAAAVGSRPFCLSISFKAPHRPVTPDPKYDALYRGKKFTRPANFGRTYGEHFSMQSRQGRQYQRFHSWGYSHDYDAVMRKYYQQIYAIDVAVGMVRQALEEAGVAENTVMIYTSDNGFMCGSHGYGSKVLPYDESSRVPMIIYDPRHANSGKQLRTGSLTGSIDIAPTILDLAEVAKPEAMDGTSLLPIYSELELDIHQHLALINVWGPSPVHSLSVVTKDWKYIYWSYRQAGFEATEELYHTANDPLELTNLAEGPEDSADLRLLRGIYDAVVEDWQRNSVTYHNYRAFADFFGR